MNPSNLTINPLMLLAERAFQWEQSALTPEMESAVRYAVLDWFATTLPGTVERPAQLVATAVSSLEGSGRALCYVTGKSMDPRSAALINATASHIVEFDDIFRDGGYHPGSATVATAIAMAQQHNCSYETFCRAIIAGYEVGCRISLAIQPSHYEKWHISSTLSTMGAATTAAVILGCDSEKIGHSISLATSFASGHQQNLMGAGMAKSMHLGHAAEAGILAAYAAWKGVTGSADALHGEKGYAAATSCSAGDWQSALSGFGEWTPIQNMTIKAHGCCGHIFAALDGIEHINQQYGLNIDQIAEINVGGYGATKTMCDRANPLTAQEARFSAQYCVAAKLVMGSVRLEAFREDALGNPAIRELMTLINVEQDPECAAAYPKRRMTRLRIRLKDGRLIEHFQKNRKGDPEEPLSIEERISKFDELVSPVIGSESTSALKKAVLEERTFEFLRSEITNPPG